PAEELVLIGQPADVARADLDGGVVARRCARLGASRTEPAPARHAVGAIPHACDLAVPRRVARRHDGDQDDGAHQKCTVAEPAAPPARGSTPVSMRVRPHTNSPTPVSVATPPATNPMTASLFALRPSA